uniref:GDSL esterase/lipase At1g29670-like n=1 Tax=Erigeron canadensis TaxID=72917 RepID=UPI001CB8F7E0|nr:GDSL esterase/lipase At1g29670-like [Erigeron canadensis]
MVNCQLNLLFSIQVFVVLMYFRIFLVIGKPQVPCYFIFGDSLVDSGNNNQLVTTIKANYPPYGADFAQGVTGRFTNGRTIADIIGELLGFNEYMPTYASIIDDQQITRGVNYGSGGSGIREETGSHMGDRISLGNQLKNHHTIVSRIFHLQQNTTFTKEYLRKCIYIVNIGSNDYINNYLKPNIYATSHMYTTYQYANILLRQYSRHLQRLYDLDARKIAVFGLGQIGCTPAEISIFGTNNELCVGSINEAVNQFNRKLKPLVDELNSNNPDSKFTFINLTSIALQQQGLGFTYVPCCILREDAQCAQSIILCPVRDSSFYYDGFHLTEVANNIAARSSYVAVKPTDASPYDIRQLVRF